MTPGSNAGRGACVYCATRKPAEEEILTAFQRDVAKTGAGEGRFHNGIAGLRRRFVNFGTSNNARLGVYLALRCAVLALVAAPKARYTMEAYPVVILCAGAFLALAARDRAKESSPLTYV